MYDAVSVSKWFILAIAEFEFSHRWIILAIAKFDFSDGWIILAILNSNLAMAKLF